MAIGINGTLKFSYEPYASGTSTGTFIRQYPYYTSSIHSVNSPIEFTALWESSGMTEANEPSAINYSGTSTTGTGDIVNVLFDIYISNDRDAGGGTYTTDWQLVTTIRKSRDMRNIEAGPPSTGGQGTSVAAGHRFTVDISEVLRDEVSYSLVPLGKGTWADWKWGGLNGGRVRQANVSLPIWQNAWVQSTNGTYTWVRVRIRTEILNADAIIEEATASGSWKSSFSSFIVINSAPQYDSNKSDANANPATFAHSGWGTSSGYARICQSWTPNYTYTSSTTYGRRVVKDMRPCEQTEVLQWYQNTINNYAIWYLAANNPEGRAYDALNASDLIKDTWLEVVCYDENWSQVSDTNGARVGRLFDFTNNLPAKVAIPVDATGGGGSAMNITDAYPRTPNRMCSQNISIAFINANIIHPNSTVQHTWEYGGKTWTREVISNGNPSDQTALFINDDVKYYRVGMKTLTTSQGAGTGVTKSSLTEYRWYRVDRSKMELQHNAPGQTYAATSTYGGIYYTELRGDYNANCQKVRCKAYYWGQSPRAFKRFHWLNTAGGIDSYTVKGTQTEKYLMNKETILRKEGSRWNAGWGKDFNTTNVCIGNPQTLGMKPPYPSANAASAGPNSPYFSDTMKGLDNHKGGREVVGVDADRLGTATTLPLNPKKAEWLKELALSPNVWIETDQLFSGPDQPYFSKIMNRSITNIGHGANMDGRTPTNSVYTPVIITNQEVNTIDEENGFTTINFEYTYGHQVVTQRN